MSTACGFCARAGYDECFCGLHPEEAGESIEEIRAERDRLGEAVERLKGECRAERDRANGTRIASDNALTRVNADILKAKAAERARLRPLLERALRALHAARPEIEVLAHHEIVADLRRELGKEE